MLKPSQASNRSPTSTLTLSRRNLHAPPSRVALSRCLYGRHLDARRIRCLRPGLLWSGLRSTSATSAPAWLLRGAAAGLLWLRPCARRVLHAADRRVGLCDRLG